MSRHRGAGGVGAGEKQWTLEELEAEWRRGDGRNLPPLPPGQDSLPDYQARAAALNRFGINLAQPDPFHPEKRLSGKSSWCDITPIQYCHYAGTLYTFAVIFALFFANAYLTCPILRGGQEACDAPIWFGYFLLAEIGANFLLFHFYARYNRFSKLFPVTLREDESVTKFCLSCKEVVPRRSHHCSLCKLCVFQKDHHCFLVGGCVGLANQRYFLGFLFWASLGAGYGTWWTFDYLYSAASSMPPFWPWGWVDYIGPLALQKWLFTQHIAIVDLTLVLLFSAGIASTMGALAFLLSQLYLISRGQTMWDVMKQNRNSASVSGSRSLSVGRRFRQILGPWWLLQFLFPIPLLKNRVDTASLCEIYQAASKDL